MMAGAQSEVAPLRRVVVRHARDAFRDDAAIDRQWQDLNYLARPDFTRAVAEYDGFVELLRDSGAAVHALPANGTVGLDSIYVRDASIVCDRGVILCSMGKPQRAAEPAAQDTALRTLGIPIHGAIAPPGRVEGGDVVWIDERTLAVGQGYRTNAEGIRQLRELLAGSIAELLVVPLPHWRGPNDVFHLMSILSPIDDDLFLAYSPLLPVPFRERLLARGIELVEVPEPEFATLGCNALAVAPRRCLLVAGNPETRTRLRRTGVEVREFAGTEICLKGGGGPTCLTRPLVRSATER